MCVGLDVIIVGIMDAMANNGWAVDADVVITTDAVEEIPSWCEGFPPGDTGRATMMHCGTAGRLRRWMRW